MLGICHILSLSLPGQLYMMMFFSYLSGIPFAKFQRFVDILKLKSIDESSYYRLRTHYVTPVIRQAWEKERKEVKVKAA